METIATSRATHRGFWKSIQGNLILLLLLLLIPTILIQAYIYHDRLETRRTKELEANLEVARAIASTFESFLQNVVDSELTIGLALTASQPISDQDRDRILDQFQAANPEFRSVLWVNASGLTVASSLRTTIGL
jgi:hypothetical protein